MKIHTSVVLSPKSLPLSLLFHKSAKVKGRNSSGVSEGLALDPSWQRNIYTPVSRKFTPASKKSTPVSRKNQYLPKFDLNEKSKKWILIIFKF